MVKKNNKNTLLSLDNIKALLKIFNKLARHRNDDKRRRKSKKQKIRKIQHESGDIILSSSSAYKASEIDKKLGEKYNQLSRDDAKKGQIVIHNNIPPIMINQDLSKIQGDLNRMLGTGTVSNEEYEKLKKGDLLILNKLLAENEEFRKLLIDTHEEKLEEHDRLQNLEELKTDEIKAQIYKLKNYEEIRAAIIKYSEIMNKNNRAYDEQQFIREMTQQYRLILKDILAKPLEDLRKLGKKYKVNGSIKGGVKNLAERIALKHILLEHYNMLDYVGGPPRV